MAEQGHQVTLLNRGTLDDGLGQRVRRLICDRVDKKALAAAVGQDNWDVVVDQVCYDYDTAQAACEIFSGKVARYIFTSSQSVYNPGKNLKESAFNPAQHQFKQKESRVSDYAEAKRQAETAFCRHGNFQSMFVRFPFVLGNDDYTGRFKFHVDRIRQGAPIYFPRIESKLSFVSSHDAARALAFLATSNALGAINVASPAPIALSDFINMIEAATGRTMLVADKMQEACHSPYGVEEDWYMDCTQLKNLGLELPTITKWLPDLLSV
jgi:nucleoside-diphosphate-sugar epimerase